MEPYRERSNGSMTQLWTPTEYAPRNGQDSNQIYPSTQIAVPCHSNNNGMNCLDGNENIHYNTMSTAYSPYSTPFINSQTGAPTVMYIPGSGPVSMQYSVQPPPLATLPSQRRSISQHPFYSSLQSHRIPQQPARLPLATEVPLSDTEEQESVNHETMRSEPVTPVLDGYPNVNDFDELMRRYVKNLSPKKQDKALIHAKRAANIKAVLIDKKTTSVESAQFRFWVKKMFTLEPRDPSIPARKKKICHEGKPVAIREKLFKILIRAHKQCSHGGRDKTSSQVRRIYSWVPKELISRFVKLCPTCQIRRGTNRPSPTVSEQNIGAFCDPQSPELVSFRQSSHHSSTTTTSSTMHSPLQMSQFSPTFHQQNRWMAPLQPVEKMVDQASSPETAASTMINMNMSSPRSPESLTPAPSKFAEDPGSPYTNHIATNDMNHSFHQHGFDGMHDNQRMPHHHHHHHHHHYKLKRDSVFKRERCY